jgi:hypothetical protein
VVGTPCISRYRLKMEGGWLVLTVTDWRGRITFHRGDPESIRSLLYEVELAEWMAERATARRIGAEGWAVLEEGTESFAEVCRYCGCRMGLVIGPRYYGVCPSCRERER